MSHVLYRERQLFGWDDGAESDSADYRSGAWERTGEQELYVPSSVDWQVRNWTFDAGHGDQLNAIAHLIVDGHAWWQLWRPTPSGFGADRTSQIANTFTRETMLPEGLKLPAGSRLECSFNSTSPIANSKPMLLLLIEALPRSASW